MSNTIVIPLSPKENNAGALAQMATMTLEQLTLLATAHKTEALAIGTSLFHGLGLLSVLFGILFFFSACMWAVKYDSWCTPNQWHQRCIALIDQKKLLNAAAA